ncbi:MAG: FtsW/RodA/SpoVE family cell cycle protein [Chlorobi bacterium]|nr:FtsW/RodA/SpoVE family cell cycle protein [Chlorobiota bacterium]
MEDSIWKYFKGDRIIWVIIAWLSVVSMLVIYSSTGNLASQYHTGSALGFMLRQAFFFLIGLLVIIGIHNVPYKWFAKLYMIFFIVAVVLLAYTLLFGPEINHAKRWIQIPFTSIRFQPSEFAKIAIVVYLARELARYQNEKITLRIYLRKLLAPLFLIIILIIPEDLSTSVLIGFAGMVLMFIGRVPLRYLISTGSIAVGLLALMLMFGKMYPEYSPRRIRIMVARLEAFSAGESGDDKIKDAHSYQSERAKMAVANGGLFGKGPGNSVQRNFLPHPYSDFVYAIIVEEYGLAGGLVVLLAYLVLLYRAGVIVRYSKRVFPALLVVGLTTVLVVQAIINMGVSVGVFPVTGQTLPLVSMGGTSVVFSCLAFGMILSVSMYAKELKEKELANENNN